MKKIKLLHILSALELTNGVASYVMNHYEKLNHELFSVDFLIVKSADQKYSDIISKHNDKIIYGPKLSIKNYRKFKQHAKALFQENSYDIVHCHEFNWGMPYLKEAKKRHIKIRIFHAHLTLSSPKLLNRIRNAMLIPITLRSANQFWSCSEVAGKYFFKDKPFYLSHNAIYGDKYTFNQEHRNDIRTLLEMDEKTKLIGFFGRFENQKNPMFTLEIFKAIAKQRKDIKLLMVGNGYKELEILAFIEKNGLKDQVIVFSARRDIYKFYSAIDLFLLPSLFEGLPVVGVEALYANLPQVYADTITKELNLIDTITYLSLKADLNVWKDRVIDLLDQKINRMNLDLNRLNKYDITHQGHVIEEKYLSLFKEVS